MKPSYLKFWDMELITSHDFKYQIACHNRQLQTVSFFEPIKKQFMIWNSQVTKCQQKYDEHCVKSRKAL